MKTIWRLLGGLLLLVIVAAGAIYFSGNTLSVIVWLNKPNHGWDPSRHVPDPDYTQASSWAALPSQPGPADFIPANVPSPGTDRAVDVFFIHPTGYMHSYDWNSPLDANSMTETPRCGSSKSSVIRPAMEPEGFRRNTRCSESLPAPTTIAVA